jgi:hypothetical protein
MLARNTHVFDYTSSVVACTLCSGGIPNLTTSMNILVYSNSKRVKSELLTFRLEPAAPQ